MQRFTNVASWQLASEFVRAFPDLRIFHTHPGGGQYDVLAILGPALSIDVNRLGSIHFLKTPRGGSLSHDEWTGQLMTDSPRRVAQGIAEMAGLAWPKHLPPTTPHVLTYRVIAQLLNSVLFDQQGWQVTTQFHDSSGDEGSMLLPSGNPEVTYLPANQVWMVTTDGTPHGWLWDGWVWLSNGSRMDIYAAYRSGRSIHDIVAAILRPNVARAFRAPALPPLPAAPEQSIGTWP